MLLSIKIEGNYYYKKLKDQIFEINYANLKGIIRVLF